MTWTDADVAQGWTDDDVAPARPQVDNRTWQDILRDDFKAQHPTVQRAVAAGTALSNLWEGLKQLGGQSDQDTIKANKVFAQERPGAALTGNLALLAPTAMIPGANTLTGAAAVGGVTGLLNPVEADNAVDAIKGKVFNATLGAAGGAAGQKIANTVTSAVTNKASALAKAASQNAPKDTALVRGQAQGYVVPPGMTDSPSLGARLLEGFGGKLQTQQQASQANQQITNSLARKAVGVADDVPLSQDVLQHVRNEAFKKGYEPIKKAGMMQVDNDFQTGLQKIIDDHVTAARDFGDVADDEVLNMVRSVGDKVMQTGAFSAESGVAKIKLLREAADKAFRTGNTGLGKANKEAANQIESLIERNLEAKGAGGAQLLKGFRDARTLMAKTHSVGKALKEGSGNVRAQTLTDQLNRGKPLTGELEDIARFSANFKNATQVPENVGSMPGFSPLDFWGAGMLGAGGAAMGGSGSGMAAAAGGFLRPVARAALLSNPGQKMFAKPQDYQLALKDLIAKSIASSGYLPVAGAQGAVQSFGQ